MGRGGAAQNGLSSDLSEVLFSLKLLLKGAKERDQVY